MIGQTDGSKTLTDFGTLDNADFCRGTTVFMLSVNLWYFTASVTVNEVEFEGEYFNNQNVMAYFWASCGWHTV